MAVLRRRLLPVDEQAGRVECRHILPHVGHIAAGCRHHLHRREPTFASALLAQARPEVRLSRNWMLMLRRYPLPGGLP